MVHGFRKNRDYFHTFSSSILSEIVLKMIQHDKVKDVSLASK